MWEKRTNLTFTVWMKAMIKKCASDSGEQLQISVEVERELNLFDNSGTVNYNVNMQRTQVVISRPDL